MKYAGDICYGGSRYTAQDGTEKTRWVKCGAYFQSEGRTGIKLEFVPVAIDPVKGLWFSLFPERKKDAPPPRPAPSPNNPAPQEDDEVPF